MMTICLRSLETRKLIPIISEVSEMNAKNAEKFMSSKEQKTPEGQAPEEIITEQHDDVEAVEPEVSAEQVDPRDEKIANLEAQLAEAQNREREVLLRAKPMK
jgi:molecular chaperone GrpE